MFERILKIRTEACFGTREECLPQTWSLFQTGDGEYFIRHWKTRDGKRRSRRIPLARQRIETILERLMKLQLPIAPEPITGCDGGFTELEIDDGWRKAHFRWWAAPGGWEELERLAYEILELAE